MTGPLSWSAEDDDAGNRVIRATGTLDLKAASPLRLAMLKALAEQPAAMLVDLAGVRLADRLALTVFTAVSRQAAMWPGVPVVLCAPPPPLAAALTRGVHRRLLVQPSVAAARAGIAAGQAPPTVADDLLPVSGAARHARDLVTDVCVRWEVPQLVFPASLVASELVSNAAQHARTMMKLRLSLRPRYLLVAVQDGSPEEPAVRPAPAGAPGEARDGGRGLPLVAALSVHWGSLPTPGGKVVWASLAVNRATGDPA